MRRSRGWEAEMGAVAAVAAAQEVRLRVVITLREGYKKRKAKWTKMPLKKVQKQGQKRPFTRSSV